MLAEVRRAYKRLRPLEREVLRLAALAQDDYPRRIVSWTLDVLNVVRAVVEEREAGRAGFEAPFDAQGKRPKKVTEAERGCEERREPAQPGMAVPPGTPLHRTFTLDEVYAHAEELAKRHPGNRNIEPKIRQQLQVLRDDLGIIEFLTPGHYRLK